MQYIAMLYGLIVFFFFNVNNNSIYCRFLYMMMNFLLEQEGQDHPLLARQIQKVTARMLHLPNISNI